MSWRDVHSAFVAMYYRVTCVDQPGRGKTAPKRSSESHHPLSKFPPFFRPTAKLPVISRHWHDHSTMPKKVAGFAHEYHDSPSDPISSGDPAARAKLFKEALTYGSRPSPNQFPKI